MATATIDYRLMDQPIQFIPRQSYRGKGVWSWRIKIYGRPITGRGTKF